MTLKQHWPLALASRLAVCALALSACEAPPVLTTTTTQAAPPTVTMPALGTVAPEGSPAATGDRGVLATTVRLQNATDIGVDLDGNLYVSQCYVKTEYGPAMYKIDPSGQLTVLVPRPVPSLSIEDDLAINARVVCAIGLAVDPAGDVYIADIESNRIRRIDRSGITPTRITTVARRALTNGPTDVAFDTHGSMYILDSNHFQVLKVDPQGSITIIAGNGTQGFSGDGGPATAAQLNTAWEMSTAVGANNYGAPGLAVDASGNVYVSDSGNARVRKIDGQGIISTIAGTGEAGFSGDSGPATAAQLSRPSGLAVDSAGNLFISDTSTPDFHDASYVRKVDLAGIISTVAGNGYCDFIEPDDLCNPSGLTFDAAGNLYILDSGNSRVRKLDLAGIFSTMVGGF